MSVPDREPVGADVKNKTAKKKSLIVWGYEILLVLTGAFSLWNYGAISLMTMDEDAPNSTASDSVTQAPSGATDNGSEGSFNSPAADNDVFLFTVLATGAALVVLAFVRLVFRSNFSKKTLHSPLLLLVFSIPILLLLVFIGGLYAFGLLG